MQWQTLPGRARILFYIQAFTRFFLFWVPVSVGAGFAMASFWSLWGAIGVSSAWLGLQLVIAVWMPWLTHARWAYALRERDLLVSRGVIFRTVTAIPTQRIQHVDVRQGPIERWMGLGRIMMYTASGMGHDGSIPGLELEDAEALRDQLVAIEGDDGV